MDIIFIIIRSIRKEKKKLFGIIIATGSEVSLALSIADKLYKKGMEYLKVCNSKIDTVEKEVMKINSSGEMEAFDGLE